MGHESYDLAVYVAINSRPKEYGDAGLEGVPWFTICTLETSSGLMLVGTGGVRVRCRRFFWY